MNTPIAPDQAISGHESKDCPLDALALPGIAPCRGRRGQGNAPRHDLPDLSSGYTAIDCPAGAQREIRVSPECAPPLREGDESRRHLRAPLSRVGFLLLSRLAQNHATPYPQRHMALPHGWFETASRAFFFSHSTRWRDNAGSNSGSWK